MKVTTSGERIKELLRIYNDTQADMVRKTGIEKSAISNYINGKREARQDKLILIGNAYNVSTAWLMGLDVPMRTGGDSDFVLNDGTILTINDRDEGAIRLALQLLNAFKNASPEVQMAVRALLKDYKSDSKHEE